MDKTKGDIDATEWETQQPDFWKDQAHAQKVSRRLAALKEDYEKWSSVKKETDELHDVTALAEAEGEAGMDADIEATLAGLEKRFANLEFATMMSEEYDEKDAIVAIHAGAGGNDAQDWAEMLLRMFFRFSERKGWKVKMLDESRGSEAGIKSATFSVEGRFAYGYFRAEAGVHRLVRISPFGAADMRQTSFALMEVLPDLGEMAETKVDPKDIRIDTYLSGGHGGQGVQTTYSAVRITHIPTNIVVTCQNERSQTQNKETAMRILQARLHARYLAERDAEKKKLRGEFTSAEWGNQIRSYVLHPYQMVKDHRTKYETADTQAVLDGDLDAFVEAYLRSQVKK